MPADARFRRIATDITRRIQAGEWPPGGPLPSRVALAAEYGVNAQTVRLAYVHLREAGLLDGEERKRVTVAHPPAMRTLTNVDAEWPYSSETTDTRARPATEELAARLDVRPGVMLRHESMECLEPGGRSAMLVSSWWQGRRRAHVSFTAELGVAPLREGQAHALGLLVDSVAYRVVRTRLDVHGAPVETADLILPLDRWIIRL
ncbi:GntR family transcriptional regulator [Streptomyces poriferorum]|uniref:GntR family transcriptional regulator n=1 Tax=Streptomyces poriferorum TaxID=2798799 RepID=A0ABY9IYV4_9ACTN|nr:MULTISPECIES: GntR family transcriptional regulator [unclassified Streptomyces]MDP5310349.1 GntR family transcriptional regulator [Streptomyces sp. Alt4]WLQ60495.1 GntR family transcriptional regulator [Streptomyces sp. Alt2]